MNNRIQNLLKNSFVFMIGNFASKILIFLLLPLYTNYLDPAEYGEVDIYINILAMLYSIVSLQSCESVFRFMVDAKTDEDKTSIISNALIISLFGIVVFSVGMIIFSAITGFEYALVFILYVSFNIFALFSQQAIRGLNYTVLYSTIGVISTFVQIASNIIFIIICKFGAVSLLWAHVVTYIFIFLSILIKCNFFRYFKLSAISFKRIKEHLAFNIPLLPNALCIWGISSLGKYLLLFFYSTSEVGLLAFATKFSQLIVAMNSILFMAWQQSAISEYNSEDKHEYATEVFNKFISLEVCATAVALPLVKIMIFTIMGEDYRLAWIYVPVFFIGTILKFCGDFASMGFFGAKKTNTVFFASLISVLLYLTVGYFGAREFYIFGVGISYAIAQLVYFLIIQVKVKKYMYAKPLLRKLLIPLITFGSSMVLYYIIDSIAILVTLSIVSIAVTLLANKQFIGEIFSMLFGKLKRKN